MFLQVVSVTRRCSLSEAVPDDLFHGILSRDNQVDRNKRHIYGKTRELHSDPPTASNGNQGGIDDERGSSWLTKAELVADAGGWAGEKRDLS